MPDAPTPRTEWPDGRLDTFERRVDGIDRQLDAVSKLADAHELNLSNMDRRSNTRNVWFLAAPGWALAIASIVIQLAHAH